MSTKKLVGLCQLTGTHGVFVDSHIIPRGLTRLSKTGEKYIEAQIGHRLKKRPDSWYDGKLVIRAGEDILENIDTAAIKELRDHRLVWSGWGTDDRLSVDEYDSTNGSMGVRQIFLKEPDRLRVFFLSLLWRAATSRRLEFAPISLNNGDLEDLRSRVLHQNAGRPEDYPIQLFQLVTRGPAHNRTPLLEQKRIINADCSEGPEISYVRFYFDGLVSHIHLARNHELSEVYLRTCLGLGINGSTIVFAHEAHESRTVENLRELISSTRDATRVID